MDPSHICDYSTACGYARSLTHWARPEIEPTSSQTLDGFLTHWATMGTLVSVLYDTRNSKYLLICWIQAIWGGGCLFRATPEYMEGPRLGVESELLSAYAITTATTDPSCICNLHHSSGQNQILNPLSKAKDQTCIFKDTSWVRYHWATTGTTKQFFKIMENRKTEIIHNS